MAMTHLLPAFYNDCHPKDHNKKISL